jgi:hypothetical protein
MYLLQPLEVGYAWSQYRDSFFSSSYYVMPVAAKPRHQDHNKDQAPLTTGTITKMLTVL